MKKAQHMSKMSFRGRIERHWSALADVLNTLVKTGFSLLSKMKRIKRIKFRISRLKRKILEIIQKEMRQKQNYANICWFQRIGTQRDIRLLISSIRSWNNSFLSLRENVLNLYIWIYCQSNVELKYRLLQE